MLVFISNNAGLVDDEELKEAIIEISQTCEICKVYRKPGYKPVVSVLLAEEFYKVVAIDLKFIESNIILHLIDHVTRFSAAAIIKSKEREEIVKHHFGLGLGFLGHHQNFSVPMAENSVMTITMRWEKHIISPSRRLLLNHRSRTA